MPSFLVQITICRMSPLEIRRPRDAVARGRPVQHRSHGRAEVLRPRQETAGDQRIRNLSSRLRLLYRGEIGRRSLIETKKSVRPLHPRRRWSDALQPVGWRIHRRRHSSHRRRPLPRPPLRAQRSPAPHATAQRGAAAAPPEAPRAPPRPCSSRNSIAQHATSCCGSVPGAVDNQPSFGDHPRPSQHCCGVAQLVERRIVNPVVAGSSPAATANLSRIASLRRRIPSFPHDDSLRRPGRPATHSLCHRVSGSFPCELMRSHDR
jgi:hypothetical protein